MTIEPAELVAAAVCDDVLARHEQPSMTILAPAAVPDEIIMRMADRFEHAGMDAWERRGAFTLHTEDRSIKDVVDDAVTFLSGVWSSAYVPLTTTKASVKSQQTELHFADLKLRSYVQRTIKQGKSSSGIDAMP